MSCGYMHRKLNFAILLLLGFRRVKFAKIIMRHVCNPMANVKVFKIRFSETNYKIFKLSVTHALIIIFYLPIFIFIIFSYRNCASTLEIYVK